MIAEKGWQITSRGTDLESEISRESLVFLAVMVQ